MATEIIKDAQTGEITEREMTPEEVAAITDPPPTAEELEAEVQDLADQLTQADERMMALALATVDLKRADTSAMNLSETRQAFRERVVFYLRQRRGL